MKYDHGDPHRRRAADRDGERAATDGRRAGRGRPAAASSLQEARGVTDSCGCYDRAGQRRLATVAPHLYHRDHADDLGSGTDTEVAAQLERLEPDQVMDDCETAFGWLG
ncbi:hypothetical protein HBB16_05090 [Pseudonocardia sp. MCCB 268]|nr:hypothetical protein [Pseudonocardia cytotoxica]